MVFEATEEKTPRPRLRSPPDDDAGKDQPRTLMAPLSALSRDPPITKEPPASLVTA
jgi:hypothetical protein